MEMYPLEKEKYLRSEEKMAKKKSGHYSLSHKYSYRIYTGKKKGIIDNLEMIEYIEGHT